MASLDPHLECLAEQQGPAFRTWQLILETAMGKVLPTPPSPSAGFQFQNSNADDINKNYSFAPAECFIPLDIPSKSTDNENSSKLKRKNSLSSSDLSLSSKSQASCSCSDDDEEALKENNTWNNIAPWKSELHYPQNAIGLHNEIKDFYNYISPLPEEEVMRKDVVQRISDLIVNLWSAAKVEVFGSFRTNLYLPTSDIDLAVFGKWENLPLYTLEKALINNDISNLEDVKVLDKATVPIIKLKDKKSKIRVDISFNTETSVESAEMIKKYVEEYNILPHLFLTIKHFLVQRDLNEVFTGGISSYCLMLLTISFLQRHPRFDVRKEKNVNLGVLLMEFFELYGRKFNYQKIGVKIRNGGCYFKKEKIAKDLVHGECPPLLCIEDPLTLACDIGRSSYGMLQVKDTFEYAFNVIDKALRTKNYFQINPNSTYLSRIISIPDDLKKYRKWVKKQQHVQLHAPLSQPSLGILKSSSYQPPPQHQQQQNSSYPGYAGRPALLPTPPSSFFPCVNLVSPITNTTNCNTYNPATFYTSNNSSRTTTFDSLNQPISNTTKNNPVITSTKTLQIGYVYQNSYPEQTNSCTINPSNHYDLANQSFSNVTSANSSSVHNQQNSMNHSINASTNGKTYANSSYVNSNSRRNNNFYYKQRDNNYDRRTSNSRNSSRSNSPRHSPKVNTKELVVQNLFINNSLDRDYSYKKDHQYNYKENRDKKSTPTEALSESDFPPMPKPVRSTIDNSEMQKDNIVRPLEEKSKTIDRKSPDYLLKNAPPSLRADYSDDEVEIINEKNSNTIVISSGQSSSDEA